MFVYKFALNTCTMESIEEKSGKHPQNCIDKIVIDKKTDCLEP